MGSVRRLPVVAAAAILALTLAVPAVAGSSPRSGDLHITKECSQYTHLAGGFCTITSSNLAAIPVGSKVIYLQALAGTVLESDVVLDPPGPGNNMAFGHVQLNLVTKVGTVTFAGGTGKFTWFTGSVVVTQNLAVPFGWFWDGTYSFSPPAD
jgi:hypothetical protein